MRCMTGSWPLGFIAVSVLALSGCSGSEEDPAFTASATGIGTLTQGSSNSGNSSEESGDDSDSSASDTMTSSSSSSSSTGLLLDIGDHGSGNATDTGSDAGCQKVDLLFVIDNSGSMQSEQASLIASFGGFVDGIQAELGSAESFHIGVVTTDGYDDNAPGCQSLGHLVTQTGGEGSSNQDCLPFSSGKRYLDDTEPNLEEKFSCIAQVGISGSGDEVQAQAGYTAVTKSLSLPGACNDGFIREDALLVVVIISDEDDAEDCIPLFGCMGGSGGDPPDWAAQFTQSKDDLPENIVMLGLVGQSGNNSCGADNCTRLIALTNWFVNGSSGDICAPSYGEFFSEAISVIDTACDNFTPPE